MDLSLDAHQRLIDDLLAFGDLKVWSVLVTIFGDLAPTRGSYLPGPFLTTITAELGIRPEAQRVALHRLRKDGWIEVQKDGRVSHYALSALARRETKSVQSRVFDARIPRPASLFLVVRDPVADPPTGDGWIPLTPVVHLTDREPPASSECLVTEIDVTQLPDWARRRAIPEDIQSTYRALTDLLEPELAAKAIPPDKRLALRILVLHRWRRLVLGHSRSAANVMGDAWVGNTCRDHVQRWLNDLPRPARAVIERQ